MMGSGCEIHGGAGAWRITRIPGGPFGEIAGARHLEGAEQRIVEMAAADHQKGVGVMEERTARQQARRSLPGVDEVGIAFTGTRRLAEAEDTVLAVEDDLAAALDEIGD